MVKICSIEKCSQKHHAKGLCRKHYDQLPKFKEKRRLHFKQLWDKDRIKWRKYYNEYVKRNKAKNPQYLIRYRLRQLVYRALERYTKLGKIFKSSKYGIDYKSIIEHLMKNFPDDIKKYQIDHIKPLSSFNLEDKEQIKLAFSPRNLQWLTIKENLTKGNRI